MNQQVMARPSHTPTLVRSPLVYILFVGEAEFHNVAKACFKLAYVVQTGLKLIAVLLSQSPGCQDCR